MEKQIVRFHDVPSLKSGALERYEIPVEAMEMIAAKDIRYYLGPMNALAAAGSGTGPAVGGTPGLSVYVVECPPGNGPMLHAHMRTRETFFCVDGRFEVRYGDRGEHRTELSPLDMIAVPTGVSRAFKNISQASAHLLVIIQGDPNDMTDIAYAPDVGKEVVRLFGPDAKSGFEKTGITFDAGVTTGD
jgi:uncharacterized RmlC-like cupin family protein